ncbi:type IV secretory system conjugative DNA transfer family protein [Sediminicola arcticus]|uniref:Type IV secretion system DNA-binding domain-containing protein n=1 Tax=Sediminicola arcticus TaxID=1574308 RepID=A0ABV2SQZ3_9FLAO
MEGLSTWNLIMIGLGGTLLFFGMYRLTKMAFWVNTFFLFFGALAAFMYSASILFWSGLLLKLILPLGLVNIIFLVFLDPERRPTGLSKKYRVEFPLVKGKLAINNLRRGISIIGAAGSGKTESVVYDLLKHFAENGFCGVIHDYKDFEITEMAYPLFQTGTPKFYIISLEHIHHRVNPIAPRYMVDEESVNEVARVLIENLMEQKEMGSTGTNKFFNDAAEGLLAGLIWKLKTSYPDHCTLPHLIAIYQLLDTDSLIAFLSSNTTSKAMASAFISGKESERQTAGVKSSLANALKKISTQRIFMALSADEVPLDINNPQHPAVVSIVNNPKFETSFSPIIATLIHTITKQMAVRNRLSSFLLMEEAPTIRLLNMHRIPATLRSYDIATVYVMQDKVQNDLMYGDKASRAILGNLSYQFFGKVNDPDTAKYYERFFEIVKRETKSVNQGHNLSFDTRITTGEKEVAKVRADTFFRLKEGEFITYADGNDKKVRFKTPKIDRGLPSDQKVFTQADLKIYFERIHLEVKALFLGDRE